MQLSPLFFADWASRLLALLVNAEAALPVILVLGLVAGRRGNAGFILAATSRLARFVLALAIVPPLWYFLDYWNQIAPFPVSGGGALGPLFIRAGYGWLFAILASSCALFCVWLAASALTAATADLPLDDDRYELSRLKTPVFLFLLAATLYFLSFWLINWPFAGLPPELSMERAVAAVGKNAARRYFMSFSAAGATGLALAAVFPVGPPALRRLAMRWLAFWAAAGYLPRLLTILGLTIGVAVGNRAPNYDLLFHVLDAGSLLCALLCWTLILIGKKTSPLIVAAGWFFLAAHASAPCLRRVLAPLL